MLTGDGTRATLAIWIVAAVLGGLALLRLADSGDGGGSDSAVRIERSPQTRGGGAHGEADAQIYVHVAGAVRRPGLVRLAAGARVAEAVEQAGGLRSRADLAGVNLAAQLEDGQQVVVPAVGASPPAAAPSGIPGAGGSPGSPGVPKLSLAAATVEQLDQVDGIGPTLAQRIIEYRTEHGGFRSVDELRDVEGIGEKRFETLREAVQP